YEKLSTEFKRTLPNVKGLNHQNLRYTEKFYTMYKKIFPQVVEELLMVPWGHHRIIIDKCKTLEKCEFYLRLTIEENLSRNDLESRILANIYERNQNTLDNFKATLPNINTKITNQIMKDPYEFDFLEIREKHDEKELKEELTKHIESFLLELGNGFAYVGKEVRLFLGYTEMYCDLLFYNIKAHCYVVVEIKTGPFKPEHMGQLIGYTATIDATLKGEDDNKTVGILVCKNKDNTLAKHIVNGVGLPVGISEYQLSNLIPEKCKSSLPTIEELEEKEEKKDEKVQVNLG
nr:PDDEXK nuclease domain-containing protein [Bacilli bacterium]